MFVLLEHDPNPTAGEAAATGREPLHWDLMVEVPGRARLVTWRLAANPLATAAPIPAAALLDHRRAYLDYEGVISDDRGRVRRIERGDATAALDAGRWLLQLAGAGLSGRFEIAPDAAGRAVFRRLA